MVGPTNRPWSTHWAAQLLESKHTRFLWFMTSIVLLILQAGVHQRCNVFHVLKADHQKTTCLATTPKSKERKPRNKHTLRSKLKCTRSSSMFGIHCTPCQQNDPNRGCVGVAHYDRSKSDHDGKISAKLPAQSLAELLPGWEVWRSGGGTLTGRAALPLLSETETQHFWVSLVV